MIVEHAFAAKSGIPFDPSGYYEFVNSEPMFTGSGYAYGPNPFFSEASNQIGVLNKAQTQLKNSLQNKINSSNFAQLSNQKQLLLSGFLDKLNSRDPAYVKPSSYIENSGKHGHHNCLTGNITFHTNESNIDELKYFLTHESMHNFDSFSGKNKYGLLRELNETYVEKDGSIADLYKSGMMQPDNADSAASWILYHLNRP